MTMNRSCRCARRAVYLLAFLGPFALASSQAASQKKADVNVCAYAKKLRESHLEDVCKNIQYLGLGTFSELKLIPAELDILKAINVNAAGREELSKQRYYFSYDQFVISIRTADEKYLDMTLRTAAAIEELKRNHKQAYTFLVATKGFATSPSLSDTPWKNKHERIFISFDKTPDFIAASAILLGNSIKDRGLDLYSNYVLISIHEDTILGTTANMGSRRIYEQEKDEQNYKSYMKDGLFFSILHEMIHCYIGYRNASSRLANTIYRTRQDAGAHDAEEVIANETAMALIGERLSAEMRKAIMNENTDLTRKPGVREALSRLAAIRAEAGNPLVIPD